MKLYNPATTDNIKIQVKGREVPMGTAPTELTVRTGNNGKGNGRLSVEVRTTATVTTKIPIKDHITNKVDAVAVTCVNH